ncbi:MAG TPA: nuclear transport factor 2 family protein, partial [Pyrinomonadaceae bacterium]|nr:nuclear transport factor 2 family protein [Pyrinomonadaceae bacterium]
MKRNVLSAALVVSAFVMVLGQAGCQKAAAPTNLADSRAAATPTPEKIDVAAIEAEITKLEHEWVNALKNGDADTIRRIMSDDIVIVNADGSTPTKAEEV